MQTFIRSKENWIGEEEFSATSICFWWHHLIPARDLLTQRIAQICCQKGRNTSTEICVRQEGASRKHQKNYWHENDKEIIRKEISILLKSNEMVLTWLYKTMSVIISIIFYFFVNFELSCFHYFLSRPYRSQFCKHKLRTRDLPPYSAKLGPLSPTFSCITKGKTFQVTFQSNNQQCLEYRTLRWNQNISS